MASRLKEDEKNEKIIRGLLKLPANKRCINCNSSGPQYVCTNFWTFICTNCSGIHREFTHRVKSVSMAKFTSQEVNALQEGGNEQAKALFLRDWDPQRHSFPDSSNVDKLRTFIKQVYVDRRYSGERNNDKAPKIKGDKEEYEQRRQEASFSGSRSPTTRSGLRSPQYDETYGRRYSGSPVSGGRNDNRNLRLNSGVKSPAHEQGPADYRSPGRLEADDRCQDDRRACANQNPKIEESRFIPGAGKTLRSSPNFQNKKDVRMSPPAVRPVRDILGEDAPALVVGEPPKSNVAPAAQVPAPVQTSITATSTVASNTKPPEPKRTVLSSLIDFDIDSEPTSARKSEESVSQSLSTPITQGNWAFFDSVTQQEEQQPKTTLSSLDATLTLLTSAEDPPVSSTTTFGSDSPSISAASHHASQHIEPSLFSTAATANQSSLMPPTVGSTTNQGWPTSVPPNAQETLTTSTQASKVSNIKKTTENQQLEKMEAKSTGRKELPADLFAALYSTPPPAMGMQTNPNDFVAGYGMPYHMPMVLPQFVSTPQPANPFDVSNQPRLPHSSTFPSMEVLQGALPSTIISSGLVRSSSFGADPLPQWMSPQQPGGYMGQQAPDSMPHQNFMNATQMGNQGFGDAANQPPALGRPPVVDQQLHSRYSQPSTPSSFFPVGGNPFG